MKTLTFRKCHRSGSKGFELIFNRYVNSRPFRYLSSRSSNTVIYAKTFSFESFSPVNTIKIFYPRNSIHFVYLSIRMMGSNENNLTPNVLFISLIASILLLIDWTNTFKMSDYFLLHDFRVITTWGDVDYTFEGASLVWVFLKYS